MRLVATLALCGLPLAAHGFTGSAGNAHGNHRRATYAVTMKGVNRRQVVTAPDSAYKSFVKAGGGEALLGVIAAGTAFYGGTRRDGLYEEVAAMAAATRSTAFVPTTRTSAARVNGQIAVEVTASAASDDFIDYLWLADAESGDVVAAQKFKRSPSGMPPVLSVQVARGRRLVALAHRSDGVTAEGAGFTAVAS